MNESELKRLIRDEIKIAMQVISSGSAGDNSKLTTEDIQALFPGLPIIPGRPIIRPYGFMSRAPTGTISATAQQGDHPGNKITLGHRDAKVPSVGVGEIKVYNVNGYTIYLSSTAIMIGNGSTFSTAVLGEALATLINSLITAITSHTHMFNYIPGTLPPATGTTQTLGNTGDFNSLKTDTFLAAKGKGL